MSTDPDIHPEALLADYVEGVLDPEDRARVEAHLRECGRCRGEVALATEARGTLAALPELDAPGRIAFAVRREIGPSGKPLRLVRSSPVTARVVAPIAAAAVLIAGGIVVATSLGDSAEQPALQAEGGGAEAPPGAPEAAEDAAAGAPQALRGGLPRYSRSPENYTQAGLVALARSLRDQARAALDQGVARTATSFYAGFDPASLPRDLRGIYRCVVSDVPPEQLIVPFTILEASFQDEPAYIASFLQGPAPDQPYDRLVIWVVGRDDCRLRSLASQRL